MPPPDSTKVSKVVVHPLVLLSVVDHFNRMKKIGSMKRVVGVLLGSNRQGVLDVSNSFAGLQLSRFLDEFQQLQRSLLAAHLPIRYVTNPKHCSPFVAHNWTVCTQLSEHVRTQVLTPQCPHLFNTTTYETTHLLLHVLFYLKIRSGRLCYYTRHPGASKTCLNVL